MLSVTQLHWLASSLTLVILKPKAKTLVFAVSGGCPADYPAVKASPLPSRDGGEAGMRPLKAKPERTEHVSCDSKALCLPSLQQSQAMSEFMRLFYNSHVMNVCGGMQPGVAEPCGCSRRGIQVH